MLNPTISTNFPRAFQLLLLCLSLSLPHFPAFLLRFFSCGVAKFFALFLGTFAPSFVESITYICLTAKLRVCGSQKKKTPRSSRQEGNLQRNCQKKRRKRKKEKLEKKAQTARQKWQIMAPQRCAIKAHLLKLNIYYSCRSR